MGGVSGQIHSWMFNQKAFWEYLGFEGGKEDSADGKYIRETIARTGSFIMGKRMFEEGTTIFYFINDGIESALNKARHSAKGKDIRIQGGANTIQQFLNAGLVDEFFIHSAYLCIRHPHEDCAQLSLYTQALSGL